ncbi:MAG: gamma-glutamyl kinase [Peptococcaceae bacterium BICA1-7]|nr:MAG: gamma-glutamyl kinase [Peptococcaceae bacterium BICA1-7]HBV97013.1 glutamate 5-kinase [Desulfotomaculum sp.]
MKKRQDLENTARMVVKVGSSSIIYKNGKPNISRMEYLARELSDLRNRGMEVILVTSGAQGVGLNRLGFSVRPRNMPQKQAVAAVGQGMLMHMYEKLFAEYGVTVGQVLLTKEDFADRSRFLNARNTLYALLELGVIPVINENDTVTVDEIRLGDNDNLAALVGGLVDADLLILLSDVDGLFSGDPRTVKNACLITDVTEITGEMEGVAGGSGSSVGTGGMVTKLQAARIAMHSGVVTVLANASEKDVVRRIVAGEELGTVFWPQVKLVNKKRWIAYGSSVQGRIYIDGGAAGALLKNGKSLLPSGVTGVEGDFGIGNTVSVLDPEGREIARGIVNYSARDIEKIKGIHSRDIKKVLGHQDFEEVIHRNNLVSTL